MKKVTVSYEMTRVYGVIDGNFTDETVERTVGFLLDDAAAAQLGGVHTPMTATTVHRRNATFSKPLLLYPTCQAAILLQPIALCR